MFWTSNRNIYTVYYTNNNFIKQKLQEHYAFTKTHTDAINFTTYKNQALNFDLSKVENMNGGT